LRPIGRIALTRMLRFVEDTSPPNRPAPDLTPTTGLDAQRSNNLSSTQAPNERRVGDWDGLFAGSIRGRRFLNKARR